ncbi:MAG: hypothetical protein PUD65_11085 [Spirochaetales bacterium]|nr:hypothetical protein [Spirochaetales bacterium]
MKKILFVVSVCLSIMISVGAVDPIPFKLKLDVNGVNNIYFTSDGGNGSLSGNKYIFPLLTSNTQTELVGQVFFHWELADDEGAVITLKFVKNDASIVDEPDRMLDETGISQDINYYVNVTDKNNQTIGSIQPDGKILSDISLTERTITVFSNKSGNEVKGFISPAKITMTVKAPIWTEGGNPTFIDAQYKGYIVANLTYN